MVANLNDIIEQTYYFEQKVFEWKSKIDENKKRIGKALGRRNRVEIKVDDQTEFCASKEVKTNISFIPDKLRDNLDKEIYKKVVQKTVMVKENDLKNLIAMLRTYGVPSKEFKQYLTVKEEIDIEKVDHLIEIEEINIEDIQGCYTVEYDEEVKVKKTK